MIDTEGALTLKTIVLTVLAFLGSWLTKLVGGWTTDLLTLIAFMTIDFVTGLIVALVFKKSPKTEGGGASSAAGLKGFFKKLMQLFFVIVGVMMDWVLKTDYIRTAVILFFIANEGLSILENGGLMGIPYPKFLRAALELLRDSSDNGKEQMVPPGGAEEGGKPPNES